MDVSFHGKMSAPPSLIPLVLTALIFPICLPRNAEALSQDASNLPGLREADGRPHPIHAPHPMTGKTLNVLDYGADPMDDGKDDMPAVKAALLDARPGDEVYFPNGVYNLQTPWDSDKSKKCHIQLRSSVNLRGESEEGAVLVSSFDDKPRLRLFRISHSLMQAAGVHDIHVSNLTLTSTWKGAWSSDPTRNNPDAGGPAYMISTTYSGTEYSSDITFERVTVMKFRSMGFRIDAGSHDIVMKGCTAHDATDVGNGGAGYGFVLQGRHPNADNGFNPNAETVYDNYFNVVADCNAQGNHIRHGALIQYYSHNNLVTGCRFSGILYGAVDLHGEDEYNNEVSYNTIRDMPLAGGIELGEKGATHDKSGPHNWIHHNAIVNCLDGIRVQFGTERALIEDNDISGNVSFKNGSGIRLGFCSFVTVRRNLIHGNRAPGFAGIRLFRNKAENQSRAGSPGNCVIEENRIFDNGGAEAILVESSEEGTEIEKNIVEN